ncbi:MAG: bifunctional diaminohydroxyphosphoribosylaminopyrimidine deaminase/5-amino-6-(5-phosphoribosylamino)uracil reductase RibD [Planctomycetota bacterium]
MQRALYLATLGRGLVEPNPMVGAVIARGRTIIAEGYHAAYGDHHAEIVALARAGDRAAGADLHVTLEPCATQGKTPPCTLAIARARVARVIIATGDPSARNGGQGLEFLARAGIPTQVGVEQSAALDVVAGFTRYQTLSRPHVILKWAMTWDGKIASHTGDSRWISSEPSRAFVHRERSLADAVLVGVGTVERDDPELTCRLVAGRNPVRVVLDPDLKTPPRSACVRTAAAVPTWIYTCRALPHDLPRDVRVVCCPGGRADLLLFTLGDLRARGVHRLLVEGGARTFASFLEARVADQVVAVVAPKLLGGARAPTPFAGTGFERIADALSLEHVQVQMLADDLVLRGFVRAPPA